MAIESSAGRNFLYKYVEEMLDFDPKYDIHTQIRMASNFYRFMPSVKTIIDTLASLVLSDITVSSSSPGNDKKIREIIDIVGFLRRVVVEYLTVGNVFPSIRIPQDKEFTCPSCKKDILLSSYKDTDIYNASKSGISLSCTACHKSVSITHKQLRIKTGDSYVMSSNMSPYLFIHPADQVSIIQAPGSNSCMYMYSISNEETSEIRRKKQYMFVLKNSPLEYIVSAFESKKGIRLSDKMIHVRDCGITGQDAGGWGVVPLMSAYKLIYYLAALRQQNLEMATLRPSPVYVLSPAAGGDQVDLSKVKDKIVSVSEDSQVFGKRNSVVFSSIPVSVQTLFADYKQLNLAGEINIAQKELAIAIGLPAEMVYGGGSQWTAASANIRMLEKRFIFLYDALDRICDKLSLVIGKVINDKNVSISTVKLRVLDDMAITNVLSGLASQNRISMSTLLARLGLDLDDEVDKIKNESKKLIELDSSQMKSRSVYERELRQENMSDEIAFEAAKRREAISVGQPMPEKLPPGARG